MSDDKKLTYTLVNLRPKSMLTKELWEKPLLTTMSAEEVTVVMVPVVREFSYVSPDDLPGLPPDREIEFGIDVLPGIEPISKAPYRMAPVELHAVARFAG